MGIFSKRPKEAPPFTPTSPFGAPPPWMVGDELQVKLYTGTDDLEVVGESYRQNELWLLSGEKPGNVVRREVYALLVAEEGNPYDPNAVAVYVQGLHVGYLSRRDAKEARPGLLRLQEKEGRPIALGAVIVGGGPGRSLGVWLSWDPDDFLPTTEAESEPAGEQPTETGPSVDLSAFDAPDSSLATPAPPPPPPAIPAGWYPNPEAPGQRYWDGAGWTEHTAP